MNRGCHVAMVDALLFGGESLLAYRYHSNFRLVKGNVCAPAMFDRVPSNSSDFEPENPWLGTC